MPEDMPDRVPEDMPDRMPDRLPDRLPEDLPVTKCVNVMVGITRSKVIWNICFSHILGSSSQLIHNFQRGRVYHQPAIDWELPSGKPTKNYGKSPCSMGKSTIFYGHVQVRKLLVITRG